MNKNNFICLLFSWLMAMTAQAQTISEPPLPSSVAGAARDGFINAFREYYTSICANNLIYKKYTFPLLNEQPRHLGRRFVENVTADDVLSVLVINTGWANNRPALMCQIAIIDPHGKIAGFFCDVWFFSENGQWFVVPLESNSFFVSSFTEKIN